MNRPTWPRPATAEDDDEGDRQMLLLAIAELALRRPGWDRTLGRLAERLSGREMFEGFKETSEGIVVPEETLLHISQVPGQALNDAGATEYVEASSPCTCIGSYCARSDPEYPQAGPCWEGVACRHGKT